MPPTYKYMANVLREELTKCGKDNQRLEARCVQLEEALEELRSSFEVRRKRAAMWVDEGELNDYWRGNCAALQVCLHKLAALSSEAPQKEEE